MNYTSFGFYTELEELRAQGLPDASFGFLENVDVGDYFHLYDFLHGHCDEFAAALSDYYGYPIEYILDSSNVLVHAYCTAEINGRKVYIDARGITTDSELFFDEFADFCTYEKKTGRFYDLKGDCQVLCHKNTLEMYCDDNRELNQDQDLVEFFKSNNSYYDIKVFERDFYMKTLKEWPEGKTITQFLQVGDRVDNTMYEHFLNIMPPHYYTGNVLQVGGACDAVENEDGVFMNTFLTFVKDNESDCWIFKGECFSREWVNRNPELEQKEQQVDIQPYKVKASVLNCKNIETAIKRAKNELMNQEMHENFGQEYVRAIRDKFAVGLSYTLEDKMNMAALSNFDHWCSTYVPNKEKTGEHHSKER